MKSRVENALGRFDFDFVCFSRVGGVEDREAFVA
jgi:hypothetical protein